MTTKAKKRLSNFDFSGANAAMALVHKDQGHAANGYKTLIMKATDVVVELSMAEFLEKFFHIWGEDAQYVANLLGYSDEISRYDWESDEHELQGKVHLMKSVHDMAKANPEITLKNLEESKRKEFLEIAKGFTEAGLIIKGLNDGAEPIETKEAPTEVIKMSTEDKVEMIEKSVMEVAIAKAVKDLSEAKDAEIEALQKSVDAATAKEVEIAKAQYVEKAQAYKSIGVEDAEAFGVALQKMAADESMAVVVKALEQALVIAKGVNEIIEDQAVVEDTEAVAKATGVMAVLKSNGKVK